MTVNNVSSSDPDSGRTPIRLLIVAPSLKILGGQAVQAKYLFEHLSSEPEFAVSFVAHNPRLPGPFRLLQKIKYVRTIVTSLLYCKNLLREIPKNDVIHVFSASYFSFLLAPTPAIFVARFFKKKVILNYRSGEAEDHLRSWPRTAVPIIRLADQLIVPSRYLVEVFRKFGLRAHAIANMIDHDRYKFRERLPLRPVFLSNRNLYPLYNVACIIRAFARIQQKFPEAKLTIAGNGRQRAELEALVRELKLQNVDFRGLVPPEKMSELYDQADIVLNSSNIYKMPGAILESFAAGMPVVTTSAGGITCILTHERTGLLVPKNDHEAMASGAIRLLESPEFAAAIARNAHAECQDYRWEAVRDSWLSAYTRLAGRDATDSVPAGAPDSSSLQGVEEG
jgi:glycosyltransferase involved in cell wall biosynthesis